MNRFNAKGLAIIPVYRDNSNARKVLSKFSEKYVDEICLVADCTSQNETTLLRKTPANIPVHIITNETRKGIGYALKQGIRYGCDNDYDYAVILAGNNKDNPQEIPRLLEPLLNDKCDYVQGSRFLSGGRRIKNPFFRGVFSRLYPFVWTTLTGVYCTDVTNGFRAYKLELFDDNKINIWQAWLDGYALEYYIHYKILTLGYRMKEVPVSKVYSHCHKGGYSQISPLRDWWQIIGPLVYLKLGIKI